MDADGVIRMDQTLLVRTRFQNLQPIQAEAPEKRLQVRPVAIAQGIFGTGGDVHGQLHGKSSSRICWDYFR